MPESLHILYLGTEGQKLGILTQEDLFAHQIESAKDWKDVRIRSSERPLDALLTDSEQLANMTQSDRIWFNSLLSKGVPIIGLGIDLDEFAYFLGADTLRTSGEATTPIGPDGAYLIYGQILGEPDEIEIMEANNWFMHSIKGEEINPPDINSLYEQIINVNEDGRTPKKTRMMKDAQFSSNSAQFEADIALYYSRNGDYANKFGVK